ncbi:MAG: DUF11 domain-containing protein, partial [Algoriphagus sp.]|nr:DUF11 domain-containing protein [Algoriphagus sp.]
TASGNEVTSNEDSETANANQIESISLDKVALTILYDAVGQELEYTLEVTNTGNVTLSNVTIADPLTGTIQNIGTLAPGLSTIVYTSYTVDQDDLDNGSVTNIATATGTPPSQSEVQDTDNAVVLARQDIAIALVKSSEFLAGEECSEAGDEILYTFKVYNMGNVSLSEVALTDPLLEGPISGPVGDTDQDGELDVSEIWTYTSSYEITQADIDAGEVVNQATVTAIGSEKQVQDLSGDQAGNDEELVTEICQTPSIDIVKTDNGSVVDAAGDVITYTLTVTNTGNVTLSNVLVTDPLTG